MSVSRTVLLGLCLLVYVSARKMGITHLMSTADENEDATDAPSNITINGLEWDVYHHSVPIDHFAYNLVDKFDMRYLVNNDFYKAGGPIFFYTGNEGNVESFVANTGIMMDLAPRFGAALIFAEHRYYGESHPFGKDAYKNAQNLGYLTSEQALADYSDLLQFLVKDRGHSKENAPAQYPSNSKIISFGGSYGGMLSAWFRMKYPHLITGSWAASAPLKYFNGGGVEWGAFDRVTTRNYQESGCNVDNIRNGWDAIIKLSKTTDGCAFLNELFNVDAKSTIKDSAGGHMLNNYIREAIEYMAMTDYPYSSSFLSDMPGYPTVEACKIVGNEKVTDEKELARRLYGASSIYYNYTGEMQTSCINPDVCGDPATASLGDALGWPWQECTEVVVEMCARGGDNDMFWNECGNAPMDVLTAVCKQMFTTPVDGKPFGWVEQTMRENAVRNLYGLDMSAYSNIILSQGHLDPWSGGGFTAEDKGINGPSGVYALEIGGAAHHLDLREPNTCDPEPVKNARYQIVNIINCWLTDGCQNPKLTPLPEFKPVEGVECKDDKNGYPWGQGPKPPIKGDSTTNNPQTNTPTTATHAPTHQSSTPTPTETSTNFVSPLSLVLPSLGAIFYLIAN